MKDRTLYLSEKEGLEVIRDGPSLWIKEEGKAGWRVPLPLVGHVVIIGNVRLDASTITLFTENNIPVTFMDKKGNEIALTIPGNHGLNSHYEEQKSLLAHEERIERYKNWLISERRKVQLKVIWKLSRRMGLSVRRRGLREEDYRTFIKKCISGPEKRSKIVKSVISGFFKEMILKSVISAGLDPHIGIYNRRDNFGMVLDIFIAIEPEVDLQAVQFLRTARVEDYVVFSSTGWELTSAGMRDVVQRFENKKKLTQRLIDSILDGLFETMRNLRSLPARRSELIS
jgi:CRISPR/Cas system-associated endonuclease Cas1